MKKELGCLRWCLVPSEGTSVGSGGPGVFSDSKTKRVFIIPSFTVHHKVERELKTEMSCHQKGLEKNVKSSGVAPSVLPSLWNMQKSCGKGISYVYKQFDGTRAGLTSQCPERTLGKVDPDRQLRARYGGEPAVKWRGADSELTNRTCFWEVPGEAAGGALEHRGGLWPSTCWTRSRCGHGSSLLKWEARLELPVLLKHAGWRRGRTGSGGAEVSLPQLVRSPKHPQNTTHTETLPVSTSDPKEKPE